MGRITSLFVHKILAQTSSSLDRRALFDSIGIDADAPVDPALMVEDSDYYDLLERIAGMDPNAPDLPLRTGASMLCDEYGAFGLAWKSAQTLRASWDRAERYALVLTSVSAYEVRNADEGVYMLLHRDGERRLGLRLSNEATIASVVAISQQVTEAPFQPRAIFFRHPPPRSVAEHERHFGCPVHFDADRDAVLAAPDTLNAPNRLGDAGLSHFFDAHLQSELGTEKPVQSLDSQVRGLIARELSEGVPKISSIAAQLAMSGRTLQRRLGDAGFSFQSLVDDARRELASRLLRDTSYSLAEIAFLTGFSEQSAFNRASRRWSGQTPRSWRLQLSNNDN